ncbi:FAD-binding oxidoreductase [Phytohabitans houttuyneae]|uniref:FAD-linked oxidase n=1 Tax=Phytohabitans houttuyneae TaxID=1076126 RepID=A0A6V8KL40_9ACTN|nr:FAD-binding oxidoreductase [Phytohabitans houttuyneae]GFJ85902.1 FAD-linked oxidase [Phytohabitans houttuyneae]
MNPQALRQRFAGQVHLPGEPGYDENRRSLNPAVDARPAVIVEAANTTDVRTALVTSRALDVPFSVQATGHGTHTANDGGILVRTGGLATALVDPDRRIARVGAGTRWGAVLAAAAPFGLAPLSGSSPDVGVTGYTLGGGVGWLGRRHGFAADSVVRAEVVTADGRTVTASADRNPDLFWALRGGGGNFGVVTALEFRLYPVARVFAGAAYFAADNAAETLAWYRDWAATAPDELSTAALLRRMPDSPEVPEAVRGRRVVMIKAMYAGDADQARCLLRPLWNAAGPVLHDDMRTMRYADAAMGGTPARYLDLFPTLPDPVLRVLAGAHEDGLASTVEIRHWGGAMAAPGADAGPVGHRDMPFSVIVDASVPALTSALRPYGSGASFLNFLADPGRTASAYTPANLRRLRSVKAAYDPDNVFRTGHNITPDVHPAARLAAR